MGGWLTSSSTRPRELGEDMPRRDAHGQRQQGAGTGSKHSHRPLQVTYRGDYNTFVGTMAERIRNAKNAAEAHETKRKHVQAFIDRFR